MTDEIDINRNPVSGQPNDTDQVNAFRRGLASDGTQDTGRSYEWGQMKSAVFARFFTETITNPVAQTSLIHYNSATVRYWINRGFNTNTPNWTIIPDEASSSGPGGQTARQVQDAINNAIAAISSLPNLRITASQITDFAAEVDARITRALTSGGSIATAIDTATANFLGRDAILQLIRANSGGGSNILGPYASKLIQIADGVTFQSSDSFTTRTDDDEGVGAFYSWRGDEAAYSLTNTDGVLQSGGAGQLATRRATGTNFVVGLGRLPWLKGDFFTPTAGGHIFYGRSPSGSGGDEIPLARIDNGNIQANITGIRGASTGDQNWITLTRADNGQPARFTTGQELDIAFEVGYGTGHLDPDDANSVDGPYHEIVLGYLTGDTYVQCDNIRVSTANTGMTNLSNPSSDFDENHHVDFWDAVHYSSHAEIEQRLRAAKAARTANTFYRLLGRLHVDRHHADRTQIDFRPAGATGGQEVVNLVDADGNPITTGMDGRIGPVPVPAVTEVAHERNQPSTPPSAPTVADDAAYNFETRTWTGITGGTGWGRDPAPHDPELVDVYQVEFLVYPDTGEIFSGPGPIERRPEGATVTTPTGITLDQARALIATWARATNATGRAPKDVLPSDIVYTAALAGYVTNSGLTALGYQTATQVQQLINTAIGNLATRTDLTALTNRVAANETSLASKIDYQVLSGNGISVTPGEIVRNGTSGAFYIVKNTLSGVTQNTLTVSPGSFVELGTTYTLPQATESVLGGVTRASDAEATAGTDDVKYMTPQNTKAAVDPRITDTDIPDTGGSRTNAPSERAVAAKIAAIPSGGGPAGEGDGVVELVQVGNDVTITTNAARQSKDTQFDIPQGANNNDTYVMDINGGRSFDISVAQMRALPEVALNASGGTVFPFVFGASVQVRSIRFARDSANPDRLFVNTERNSDNFTFRIFKKEVPVTVTTNNDPRFAGANEGQIWEADAAGNPTPVDKPTGGGAAPSPASETQAGIVEYATLAEANDPSVNDKAMTPSRTISTILARAPNATAQRRGLVELATPDEAEAGTDDQRAVTPEGLQQALDEYIPPASNDPRLPGSPADNTLVGPYDNARRSYPPRSVQDFRNDIGAQSQSDVDGRINNRIDNDALSGKAGEGSTANAPTQRQVNESLSGKADAGDIPDLTPFIEYKAISTSAQDIAAGDVVRYLNNYYISPAARSNITTLNFQVSDYIQINGTTPPTASTTTPGIVELATNSETRSATTSRAVTPGGLNNRLLSFIEYVTLSTSGQSISAGDIVRFGSNYYISPAARSGVTTGNFVQSQYVQINGGGSASVPNASTTTRGIVELATDSEAQTSTSDSVVITPGNLRNLTATTSRRGLAEFATNAQTQAGTSASLAVTPAGLRAVVGNGATSKLELSPSSSVITLPTNYREYDVLFFTYTNTNPREARHGAFLIDTLVASGTQVIRTQGGDDATWNASTRTFTRVGTTWNFNDATVVRYGVSGGDLPAIPSNPTRRQYFQVAPGQSTGSIAPPPDAFTEWVRDHSQSFNIPRTGQVPARPIDTTFDLPNSDEAYVWEFVDSGGRSIDVTLTPNIIRALPVNTATTSENIWQGGAGQVVEKFGQHVNTVGGLSPVVLYFARLSTFRFRFAVNNLAPNPATPGNTILNIYRQQVVAES